MSVLAGCSDPAGPEGEHQVQVTAFARGSDQVGDASGAVEAVEVDRVMLVLGRVKLETAGLEGTTDFVDERSVVVPLALNGSGVLAVDADPPAGAYKELEISVDKLEVGHPAEQALIESFPGLREASILVEGTLHRPGGAPESFRVAYDADIDLELGFVPPLIVDVIEGREVLMSLVLDLSTWFRDETDRLLDPTDPDNRSIVMANIQKSIEFFEDPQRDGR
jgi:hypothetical protein